MLSVRQISESLNNYISRDQPDMLHINRDSRKISNSKHFFDEESQMLSANQVARFISKLYIKMESMN